MTHASLCRAVLLAGGAGRRLGGGKPVCALAGKPLIHHTAARLSGHALAVAGDAQAAALLGVPYLPDAWPGRPGPLAGVLAALRWAGPGQRVLVTPCDMPFLPTGLGARLATAPEAAIAVPTWRGRTQHGVALWPTSCAPLVEAVLAAGGRALRDPRLAAHWHPIPFDELDPDPFLDIDTPEDITQAERRLAGQD